jgi:ABC-type glycerol-3-phosphate transport system substrate-binding protein
VNLNRLINHEGLNLNLGTRNANIRKSLFLIVVFIALLPGRLGAESRSISLLFFHFEQRSYNLNQRSIPDSIDAYIGKYRPYLVNPDSLKNRMLRHFDFAADQLAQKRIFDLLDRFKRRLAGREEFRDTDLEIKVHFILWDEALETLQREARDPTFNIVQIAPEFLGGIAGHGNVISLDPYVRGGDPRDDYAPACLQSCRIGNKGPLLALPFWVSMRTLFVRKDMINAVPGFRPEEAFSSWAAFERAGLLFNGKLDSLRRNGFPNLKRFWAINIHDKDMNTLQNLTPVIYSHGGRILKDKGWWKETGFDRPPAMEGIRTYFEAAKSVGALEDTTFGKLLDHFHAGRYAVVLCGTWDLAYWRGTNPDSSSLIEIRLPPSSSGNPATLLEGCNLVILKQPGAGDYRIEYELLRYLSTDSLIQTGYVPAGARLSVLKSARDPLTRPEYYEWLNRPGLAQPFPNDGEMSTIFNALTHKYRLASILQNIKNAPSLSENVWEVAADAIHSTADNLNRKIIPAPIYYAFYTKINILVILFLLGAVAFAAQRMTSRLRRLSEEKRRIEFDLTARLQSMQAEKLELEQRQKEAIRELYENQGKIKMLTTQLSLLSGEGDDANIQSHMQTIEQVSTQILSLTSKSRNLQAELDQTSEKILTSEQAVSKLESELDDLKTPGVYIDFRKNAVLKRDGTEFILSNAARQYKSDFFRYLEFIVRHRLDRIHLLVFGFLDIQIFRKFLTDRTVREYNYKGKFGKVKSGINRTFRNNIGRELIVHDDLKVYVYFGARDTVFQISSKNREIDLTLSPLKEKDSPQVLALSAYENLDYYALDPAIRLRSSIQESRDRFKAASDMPQGDERRNALEQAFFLDPGNRPCLFELLRARPFDYLQEAGRAEKELEDAVSDLEAFLALDLEYDKKITNLPRIKEDFREVYSWSRVDRSISVEMEKIGSAAFREILLRERSFLESLLVESREHRRRLSVFRRNVGALQNAARIFRNRMEKERLIKRLSNFAETIDLFSESPSPDDTNPFLPGFIAYLAGLVSLASGRPADPEAVRAAQDFGAWLAQKTDPPTREWNRNLSEYEGERGWTADQKRDLGKFISDCFRA